MRINHYSLAMARYRGFGRFGDATGGNYAQLDAAARQAVAIFEETYNAASLKASLVTGTYAAQAQSNLQNARTALDSLEKLLATIESSGDSATPDAWNTWKQFAQSIGNSLTAMDKLLLAGVKTSAIDTSLSSLNSINPIMPIVDAGSSLADAAKAAADKIKKAVDDAGKDPTGKCSLPFGLCDIAKALPWVVGGLGLIYFGPVLARALGLFIPNKRRY
jgi:hypothetical protein